MDEVLWEKGKGKLKAYIAALAALTVGYREDGTAYLFWEGNRILIRINGVAIIVQDTVVVFIHKVSIFVDKPTQCIYEPTVLIDEVAILIDKVAILVDTSAEHVDKVAILVDTSAEHVDKVALCIDESGIWIDQSPVSVDIVAISVDKVTFFVGINTFYNIPIFVDDVTISVNVNTLGRVTILRATLSDITFNSGSWAATATITPTPTIASRPINRWDTRRYGRPSGWSLWRGRGRGRGNGRSWWRNRRSWWRNRRSGRGRRSGRSRWRGRRGGRSRWRGRSRSRGRAVCPPSIAVGADPSPEDIVPAVVDSNPAPPALRHQVIMYPIVYIFFVRVVITWVDVRRGPESINERVFIAALEHIQCCEPSFKDIIFQQL